ncbi:Protein FAM186B [Manis javanica]|nr:Protein FAM186B [Manis javanica]
MEKDEPPKLVAPASVKAIILRIEAAQLTRAQEDISSQLSDILDNVNCVINRFQEELGYDLKEKTKSHQMEKRGKKRFVLLAKIASSKDAKTKEKHLYKILHWLADWGQHLLGAECRGRCRGSSASPVKHSHSCQHLSSTPQRGKYDSLTYEIRNRKNKEEEEALDEWIDMMEKVLPLSLITTKGGTESLISICSALIEGQKKKKTQMSTRTFWQGWQGWQEQSLQKLTSYPQPLSPEFMLQDKQTTCTSVSEVKSMPQELLDSTTFSQEEVRAISQQGNQMDAVWKADVASSSHPIEEKTPTSLLWDHLGGCPDIPRQFTLDVHSFYHKSLMSLKARPGSRRTSRKPALALRLLPSPRRNCWSWQPRNESSLGL